MMYLHRVSLLTPPRSCFSPLRHLSTFFFPPLLSGDAPPSPCQAACTPELCTCRAPGGGGVESFSVFTGEISHPLSFFFFIVHISYSKKLIGSIEKTRRSDIILCMHV